MTEKALVLKVDKDFVQVRIGRNSACAACGKCGMTEGQKHIDVYAKNNCEAKVGDTVEVEIPEASTAGLALVAYGIPLLPALVVFFAMVLSNRPEWASILGFLGGYAVGFAVLAILDKARKHKWAQSPVATKVIQTAPACAEK